MDLQQDFDMIINLLKKQENVLVSELLKDHCYQLAFSTFNNETKVKKEELVKIYNSRSDFEKLRNNKFVLGYETLLPKLTKTCQNYVCISNIINHNGSYMIFTDYAKTEFIGILKSKRTLPEIREKYKNEQEFFNNNNYNIKMNVTIFINGLIIK